ncbi:transporter [Viridibacillus sp. YIM B01967]|uniref:Transporter n=1 Tax=Viridibacillus soli TaxID=2798301 RepID=A0ABS1HCI8_9BACL|nr:transporter [Viridibacillus soli]
MSPSTLSSPPGFSPPIPAWQVGPSGLRRCLFRNTYIWLNNGNSFWFFPTFVGRNTIIGFRWSRRRFGWVYHMINPNTVRSFQCF